MLRRGGSLGQLQVAVPVVVDEVSDHARHLLRVVVRARGLGQAAEPNRQHLLKVDPDLPRAGFIGEEHDGVAALVQWTEEAEKSVDRLARLG